MGRPTLRHIEEGNQSLVIAYYYILSNGIWAFIDKRLYRINFTLKNEDQKITYCMFLEL